MTSLWKQSFWMVLGRICVKAVNALLIIVLLGVLTDAEVGSYGFFVSTMFLCTTFSSAGCRFTIAQCAGEDARFLNVPIVIGAVFGGVNASLIIVFYSVTGANIEVPFILVLIAAFSSICLYIYQAKYLFEGRNLSFSLIEAMPKLIFLIIFLFRVILGQSSVIPVVLDVIVSYIVSFIVYVVFFDLKLKFYSSDFYIKFVTKGLIYAITLSFILANARIPIFFAQYYFDEEVVGNVFASIRVTDVVLEVATAVGLVIFSSAAKKGISKEFAYLIMAIVVFSTISSAFFYFFGESVSDFLFGNKMKHLPVMLSIVALGMPFMALNKVIYGLASGKGRPAIGLISYAFGLFVNLSLAILLIESGWEYSFLYALVLSQIVISICLLTICRLLKVI